MSDEKFSAERREAKSLGKDITPLLKGWDYEPGAINVRKISGLDGAPKLQMRLDLGLLQMELTGRPDGAKPHGVHVRAYISVAFGCPYEGAVAPSAVSSLAQRLLALAIDRLAPAQVRFEEAHRAER